MQVIHQYQNRGQNQITSKDDGEDCAQLHSCLPTLSILGLLLCATILSGFLLSSTKASADTASSATSSNASVTVASTCSMTAKVDSAHTATIPNGIYSGASGYYPNGIGQTTIQTFCNDPNGYAIYAIGYGNNEEGNTKLHSSSLGNNHDIATGTATSGDTSNWAMKIGAVSGTYAPTIDNSYNDFKAVPATYDKVAHFSSGTDATVGSSVTTTYAAYVSGTQPAGTYTGQVKYVLMHPSNSDSPAVTTMQNVGYWGGSLSVGDEVTATDNRDGKTYTVARLCTNWSGNNCTESQLWMTQNLDLALSPSTPLTSQNTDLTAYQDSSQNNFAGYTVDNTGIITWTPNSTLTTPATISDFSYKSSATTAVTGWTNSPVYPYRAEGKLNGNDVYIVTSGTTGYDTIHGTLDACKAAQSGTDAEKASICAHYKVGDYYNWTAAVAMNNTNGYNTQYTVMPNSICPAGWRLPQGLDGTTPNPANTADADAVAATTISEFNKMLYANGIANGQGFNGGTTGGGQNVGFTGTGFNNIRSKSTYNGTNLPLYFVRAGYVDNTTLYGSSYNGNYWSSSVVSDSYAYHLYFRSGSLAPADRDDRLNGWSVRCVARD